MRLVWMNITQNKFKTIMTSIGIIVGAATIVMVIAIGKGGKEDVADQFKNLNAGAIDISYDGGNSNEKSSSDDGGGGGMGMPSGGAPGGAPGGNSSGGGGNAPGGDPPGGSDASGGDFPGGGMFFGGQDMEERMNQENITLDEDDLDDIETFTSGISDATISYTTRASVDGGDLDEAATYTIA